MPATEAGSADSRRVSGVTNTVITGASSGLGAEMARQLAADGEDLALCARRIDRLEELRADLLDAYPQRRIEISELDVTDADRVFEVFDGFADSFGRLDRVIVNAGMGGGGPIGTGAHEANRRIATTNFVAALTQCEAAMAIFRAQREGHLVVIASIAGLRGMPKQMTTYAATKAAVAHLAEGIRAEMLGDPKLDIDVTTIQPGFIRTELTEGAKVPFLVDAEVGVRGIVSAIKARKAEARVPAWPWLPIGTGMKHLPLGVVRRVL